MSGAAKEVQGAENSCDAEEIVAVGIQPYPTSFGEIRGADDLRCHGPRFISAGQAEEPQHDSTGQEKLGSKRSIGLE